jgi:predicted nucleic-acid-binding protein
LIGLDTNVLVRYMIQDDPDQARRTNALLSELDETNVGYVSLVALLELHWVLRSSYKIRRQDVGRIIRRLLKTRELEVQHADVVQRALDRTNDQFDFPDALIAELGMRAGCEYTATFDSASAKLPGMKLLSGRK